jgi:hypothetical protein
MMTKKIGPSLYFASDKVIFDALNHRQVKTDVIRELLFERGIIVSPKTKKQDLAYYFSRLPSDWFDQANIAGKLGRIARRERITFAEVSEPLAESKILEALNSLRQVLQDQGHLVDIEKKEGGRLQAHITYEHVDYTEVEFRQVQVRDAIIEFVPDEGQKFFVRSTKNHFTDVAVEQLFGSLKSPEGKDLVRHEITLEAHADPKLRIKFFESLMHGIAGHTFQTVTEAYCFKPKLAAEIKKDNEEEDEPADLEKQPYVERVGLKGDGVNRSFVAEELYERDYYIIKVVWRVKPDASLDSDVFELETQFNEPDSCTGFSYQARCAYIFEDGKLTDKKRLVKAEEEDTLFRLIESGAKSALEALKGEHA